MLVCYSHFYLCGLEFFYFCLFSVDQEGLFYSTGIVSLQQETTGHRKMSLYTEGEIARLRSFFERVLLS